MNKRIKHFGIMTLAALSIFSTQVFAQSGSTASAAPAKLNIGDPAPKLKYSKWIQGKPVTEIKEDKIYVVEFWATWCGPCIMAMPHLSKLAEEYSKTHVFIGCNVLEKVGDKPYESSTAKVTRFVQKQNELKRMTYNVIMDNNAQDMNKNWLEAAGVEGIPSSFVIQKGKIAWIGHPDGLNDILKAIAEGSYDVDKARAEFDKQQAEGLAFTKKMEDHKSLIAKAESEKDYTKALGYVDAAMADMPDFKFVFMTDKFRILLDQFGEDKAIAYGDEVLKGNVGVQSLTIYMLQREDLSPKMKKYSVDFGRQLKKDSPAIYHVVALLEARAGYYKEAAASEQQAIDGAIELVKVQPEMKGFFNDDLLKEYKINLEDYKKKAAK
ncbi:TlpA family protein disulfide reductase [Flavobacterium sp. FlaQc-48]|uniref:TlpA family protein disulfide reductase n=1 Tax=Flavobacterium sp. FlaQc-48 TaxID=3374181 RepID=UPI003756BFC9